MSDEDQKPPSPPEQPWTAPAHPDPPSHQRAEDKPLDVTREEIAESLDLDAAKLDESSRMSLDRTAMSTHRTRLSEHRTDLSEHRTGLSEHRTDLSEHRTALSEERTEGSKQRTAMAMQRSRLAEERTLMAWVRTATSMISFAFTIYKFFQEMFANAPQQRHLLSARDVALALTIVGTLSLAGAMWQHNQNLRDLERQGAPHRFSIAFAAGILIVVLGLATFFAVFLRA